MKKGFGVIEVLVSLTIISMVLIAIISLSNMAFLSWEDAQNKAIAQELIESNIEGLHNMRDTAILGGNSWPITSSSASSTDVPRNGKNFTVTTKIDNLAPTIGTENRITITVSWNERAGNKSVTSITYLSDWRGKY